MITVKEVMRQYKISRPTVQVWMKKGLPYHKIGRLVRFDPVEVEGWIKRSGK